MKHFILLLFFIIPKVASAQELEIIDGDYVYTKVIDVNKTKNDIYSTLKKWINNSSFKTKYFIDQDDPDIGIISYNETLPRMDYDSFQSSMVSYKINIEIKDKKIRYRVNNFVFNNSLGGLVDIKRNYTNFITDIETETNKFNSNTKLSELEQKPRLKKKFEIEALDARNNLRSLTELKELIHNQILLNEKAIIDTLNKNDDW